VRAPFDVRRDAQIPLQGEQKVYVHERYPAVILGAEGELTWQPNTSEQFWVAEGKLMGKSYSVQMTPNEIELYEGKPIAETTLAAAFGNDEWVNKIVTRSKNRSTSILLGVIAGIFACLAICAGLAGSFRKGDLISSQTVSLNSETPMQTFTMPIDSSRPALVEVRIQNGLPLQSFAEVDLSVTTPNGDELSLVNHEFWHESGTEEGVRWEESNYRGTGRFVPATTGDYNFLVEMGETTADVNGMDVEVNVYKNYIFNWWMLGYGVLAFLVAALMFVRAAQKTVM